MAGRAELDRGRGLRAKCKSLSKPTWNHHERRPNNSFENVFQRFAWSFVSFFRRKHYFRRRISTFVWRILFEEPRIWTSGFNLRTRVLKSVTAAQERLDMRSGCHAAKILPVGVRDTKHVWCLSSLLFADGPQRRRKLTSRQMRRNNRLSTLPKEVCDRLSQLICLDLPQLSWSPLCCWDISSSPWTFKDM